jgi:hypothetical protein
VNLIRTESCTEAAGENKKKKTWKIMENMDFFCELFNGALHIEAPRLRIIG